ncbi:cell division topological specificity factor MinE [Clostridium tyrobutyricum]|jgi:cell division topological specificity factor|uniref:Cell division topological specificity factor n=1 Tax=Clostridium tyrobutyricum DIVETGP TaxID=1408889 RepID=W6N7U9_CLOTY|nr:cell division topological specificity factor MinE [Clostridium tyrobutyricum]AND85700.1 cell division topological specificity factor [Clostridium tyrobutyricum]ANP70220.1 cell division topological specificity factor MinE [Clostridium tyrobutyricum]MBR9647857.1 cell division topological specificity factor MinE [Clostridium tyrobutyricum]MBV4415010.1 cell division topological specificity factor MinE [Clostridium tyrobutyricum]MBV4419937.1 cell division topological specificity factor MinE [Clo
MDLFKIFSKKPSKEVAKERLRLILIHDRSNMSPDLLENIKEDILKVLSKYIEIDCGDVEVKMTSAEEDVGEGSPALVASIPIKKVKHKN